MNKYVIECKHHKEITWKTLEKYWTKIKKECIVFVFNAKPIIIYRENRKPIMVMSLFKLNNKTVRAVTSYNLWKQTVDTLFANHPNHKD